VLLIDDNSGHGARIACRPRACPV